ncbi:glucosamine-6-phosphate deaminase [Vagococcus vulneris]|uniref:Glucosamine-6-phosphate deaminase n=1 Tax=Vagococcus vulneris TaxID=1977869 RepID=A0A429ZZP4_9ENTE|nr:glucosamine-6-phosphate deaminase [Vagococcus vulneris]RST99511.1 glucosamine-6-phosphate deaminase [Vagococcus vulneris]
MKIITVKDQVEGGKKAFDLIKNAMGNHEIKTLGLATGSTPKTLYKEMVTSNLDFRNLQSINLDEYVGLPANNSQSYHFFMEEHLFKAKPFKINYIPNGVAENIEAECIRYNKIIDENPVDIQILGIGENAHIGFNEPGSSFGSETREVALTESTIKANSRNFENISDVPTHAISMGIKSIMHAKKIILLAFGEKKAEAVKQTITGPISEDIPSSVLQLHPDVTLIVDQAAASKIDA